MDKGRDAGGAPGADRTGMGGKLALVLIGPGRSVRDQVLKHLGRHHEDRTGLARGEKRGRLHRPGGCKIGAA